MKKNIKKIICFLFVFITAFSVFAEGVDERRSIIEQLSNNSNSSSGNKYSTAEGYARIEKDMASLTSLYKYIERNFLWDIDYQKIYEAMASAMFKSLDDRYSYYVTADESSDYMQRTTGKYGGIGIYFSKTNLQYQDKEDESTLYPYITQVFPASPADKVGLKAGDLILEIDGESTVSISPDDCAALMKGDENTTVNLKIKRGELIFDVSPVRAIINVPSVTYGMVTEEIGYMMINQFYQQTLNDLSDALTKLQNDGMKALIIDLRDCVGGNVQATINIANLFIKNADLLYVNYKDPSKSYSYKADSTLALSSDIPIAILVNKNTASSAEILSSAMRDNNRAVLIGTTTYGKGIMQAVSSYGTGNFSVTVAEFVPPSKTPIHKVGVEPDIVVDSIYIPSEQKDAYLELSTSDLIPSFVKNHPDYTMENVQLFIDENADLEVNKEIIEVLVRNEYYRNMPAENVPVADPWYDPQVKEAISYLNEKLSVNTNK